MIRWAMMALTVKACSMPFASEEKDGEKGSSDHPEPIAGGWVLVDEFRNSETVAQKFPGEKAGEYWIIRSEISFEDDNPSVIKEISIKELQYDYRPREGVRELVAYTYAKIRNNLNVSTHYNKITDPNEIDWLFTRDPGEPSKRRAPSIADYEPHTTMSISDYR